MRVYILFDQRPITEHDTHGLERVVDDDNWNPVAYGQNDCTLDNLKDQIRIVLLARNLNLI